MLSITETVAQITSQVKQTEPESIPLEQALGRILAKTLAAKTDQPPFPASSMDGYAVKYGVKQGDALKIIGSSLAGHGFKGQIDKTQAIEIFTGAPLPETADTIIIQENITRIDQTIILNETPKSGQNIRPRASDFSKNSCLLSKGTLMKSREIGLAAAFGYGQIYVHKRPKIALIATGDELVLPGEQLKENQIFCSNLHAVAAMSAHFGAEIIYTELVEDHLEKIKKSICSATAADIILTMGGVSVGKYDFIHKALEDLGIKPSIWKVAMRPGKPFLFSKSGQTYILGLPGNPISALVCARIFLKPLIEAMLGFYPTIEQRFARLGASLNANDQRQEFMRAQLKWSPEGVPIVFADKRQDSALLSVLIKAQALIIRPPFAPAAQPGDLVEILPIDF